MTPRELITEHYLTAARVGDFDTAYRYFADDLRIHIPGRSEWAGEQHAVDYIEAARARFAGRIELEVTDVLASDERVILMVTERFLGDGPPLVIRRANAYTVRDDRIVEIAIFEGDQYAVDERVH